MPFHPILNNQMNYRTENENHIFIVEDDLYMQSVLKYCFTKKYTTSIFNNGMAAMTALQNGMIPDLIVTDLNTPFLNGLELIKQVKASGFFSSIPVIILTGDHSSDNRIKCLSEGADDYVLKPFNPKELEIRVNIALKRTDRLYSLKHA